MTTVGNEDPGRINISDFLPHKAPMLMVHRISELSNDRVVAEFDVDEECIFVQDSTLQGTGLIENLAQVCSIIIGQKYFPPHAGQKNNKSSVIGYINSINHLEVQHLPRLGSTLVAEAKMTSCVNIGSADFCKMECNGNVDGRQSIICGLNFLIEQVAP